MVILWLSHSAKHGGAELCLLEAINGLSKRHHESFVLLPQSGVLQASIDEMHYDYYRCLSWVHTGVLISPIKYTFVRFFSHLVCLLRLVGQVRKIKPDVIITNTLMVPIGALASSICGVAHVWYIHEFLHEDHGAAFDYGDKFSYWYISTFSKHVITTSDAVKTKFARLLSTPITTVYCASMCTIPSDGFQPSTVTEHVIGIVGRIANGKNQIEAIRALSELRDRGYDSIKLRMIGDADPAYLQQVNILLARFKMENMVEMLPFSQSPYELLLDAQICLTCSVREAFGRTTVEAMKCGKVVIGARSGGTTEIIDDSVNGLLYEPGDHVDLANKIEFLIKNKHIIPSIISHAQKRSSEYSLEKYASDIEQVLLESIR